ncbi:hypothetical protein YZ82_01400 [Campylobacter hyointestinalis]|uniref:Uncharacterized protein n=1 Tax=Campylobacter hyointestinalis TaxID=198 RepID=A0A562XKD4_CAMHY|nr:hypothetical protein [Campylobacter hyointestinalis]TWO22598.1 hypothetical protein YZ82_01400 [Campylobacter hyointestinalis]
MDKKQEIQEVLAERRKTHGDYPRVALLHFLLQDTFDTASTNEKSTYYPYQIIAINMIFHKLARIGCGNSCEIDHWRDIAGYATLVVKELEKLDKEGDVDTTN